MELKVAGIQQLNFMTNQSGDRKIQNRFNFSNFRLNQLTKVLSNYLQLKLENKYSELTAQVSKSTNNVVEAARNAFKEFNKGLEA